MQDNSFLKNTVNDEVELKSEKGIDYTKLRNLLAAKNWQEADRETAKAMRKAAEKNLDNFPCEDLRTINQLWLHYSDGKFGFSVQKEIYESLGGTRNNNYYVFRQLGGCVGWIEDENWVSYSELFDMTLENAKRGHLPTPPNYDKAFLDLSHAETQIIGSIKNQNQAEGYYWGTPIKEYVAILTKRLDLFSSLARRLVDCKIF